MIKIVIVVGISLIVSACSFLEVRVDVGQRSVLDNGNYKAKKIDDDNSGIETDVTKTIIKTIP